MRWMILLDVDDLILACLKCDQQEIKSIIEKHFKLGKYEIEDSEFCGKRIRLQNGVITVHVWKLSRRCVGKLPFWHRAFRRLVWRIYG